MAEDAGRAEDAGCRTGRRYRVAVNDDGASLWQYRQVPLSSERFLRAAVDRMDGADLLCWGAGNTRFWYGSDVVEDLDTGQQVFETVQEWMAHTTLRSLRAAGLQPLALVCERCRRRGIHLYASLRMNDGHFAFPPPADAPDPGAADFGTPHPDQLWNHQRGPQASPLTAQFWRSHPEYRIGRNWPGSVFTAHLLDYAHAEVRAWWLRVAADIAARFAIDGIELDFMRNPFFFQPAQVSAGRPLMTAFVREVRETLNEAGRRRGRRLGLAARCPTSLAGCDAVGLDVETWVGAGLIDVLIPSPTRTNKFEIDLRPFAALRRGTGCQVLAGLDTAMPNQTWEQTRALQAEDRRHAPAAAAAEPPEGEPPDAESPSAESPDAEHRLLEAIRHKREGKRGVLEAMPLNLWRALAANAYLDGVDGIYVFNLWDQIARHGRHLDGAILRDGRAPEALRRRDKLYALDFEAGGSGVGHPQAHLAQPASLPLVLAEGEPAELRLKVADVLTEVPAAELAEVRLHLLLVNLTPVDRLRVRLNGSAIDRYCDAPTLRPGAPTGPNSAFVDLIYDLRRHAPRRGINVVTVTLAHKNPQVRPAVYLRELELSIRYRRGESGAAVETA